MTKKEIIETIEYHLIRGAGDPLDMEYPMKARIRKIDEKGKRTSDLIKISKLIEGIEKCINSTK